MSIYIMSDIHGDYKKYMQMLELLQFNKEDTLYILGDVIDRGENGMKILQDMMKHSNIIPILGNHEYMAVKALKWLMTEVTEKRIKTINEDTLLIFTEWINVGGEATINEFYKLSREEKEEILEYLLNFEVYETVEIGMRSFVLVHAGLENFSEKRSMEDYSFLELIFGRTDYESVYFKDKYLVTGHTPTRLIYATEQGILLEQMDPFQYQDEIFMKNNHIAIDCGCGYGGRLGAICLDTMERYYV